MMKKKGGGGCGCLSALSRACDSACDLYVRGMSGCARHVPSVGVVGRGFGGAGAPSLRLRVSSDKADDLVRAAAAAATRRQRRVAAEPEAAGKMGSTEAAAAARSPARRKPVAAAMGTIYEDAPCEFGPDGACAVLFPSVKPPPPRRGGSGVVKADDVFAR
ncbi:hypothetical protein BS78_03G287800 [Paspalum vaginatum]|nr:hypothetical protein BS78_03G287800 [Paspalum vaginatum]